MPHHTASRPHACVPVFQAGARIAVLPPLPLSQAYDYRVPEGMTLRPGDVVRVPLGRRTVTGVVWKEGEGKVATERLRFVDARLDAPPLPESLRGFVEWVADYTLSPPGAVLRMVLSVPQALEPPPPRIAYRPGRTLNEAGLRETPARRAVLEVLAGRAPLTPAELARAAGVGRAVLRPLVDSGVLETLALPSESDESGLPPSLSPAFSAGLTLSGDQEQAASRLRAGIEEGFSVTLLQGVTGSGKTEVYFEAVAAALAAGRQVLVLLPEIALTAQWLDRFAARFGAPPAVWHSDLTPLLRRTTWRAVARGRAPVVVGARSALFLPFPALGLVIVDEEHDPAFKQEDGVFYHARDMAVVRARLGDFPAVLSSATPSLETVANVQAGRYRRLVLPERHGGAELPEIGLVDLRRHTPESGDWGVSFLSPPLVAALDRTLDAGDQAMLFLNRRGYAPLTLCRACGHRMRCPNCTAWLVEHRGAGGSAGRLQCHHCGHAEPMPDACPSCGAEGRFAPCGPGVERLAREVAGRFPKARIATMTSDTVSGPAAAEALVRRMAAGEVDLLIGTQMMAKGHHFPALALVGVVDGDLGLAGGDLRACERTVQLLWQVAGRAGRASRPGRALIQTNEPDHPVMRALAAGDLDGFLAAEAEQRRALGMPPFGRLVAIIVSGEDEAAVDAQARALARHAPHGSGVEVLGPAPAPLAVLRRRHRRRLLLRALRPRRVQPLVRAWLAVAPRERGVRVQVDVDPYSFL